MKRILVITPFFAPHVGGSQQYMEDLYATLLETHTDVTVDVLCYNTDHASNEEMYRGMHVYRLSGLSLLPGQFAIPNPVSLIAWLQQHRHDYDLVHVSTRFFETAWWAPLFAKLTHTPIILTDHCAYHPVHANPIVRFIAKQLDLLFIPHILKSYDTIFATNKATQAFLKTSLHTKSEVMYGGVDTTLFHKEHSKSEIQNSKLKITYVGRMIESKGVRFLFEIAKKHPEYDFYFAGPGALLEPFKKEVLEHTYTHIHLLGSLKKPEVITLLLQSDIFVHPSFHHEGFPNSLLEAGALGLPIIATPVGGTEEIIIPNRTGIIVPQKDEKALEAAIISLASDEARRNQLREAIYQHVQSTFSWKEIAKEHYAYLQQKLA